jgi:hypothetical protein
VIKGLAALVAGLALASASAGGTKKEPTLYAFLSGSGPHPLVHVDPDSLRPVGKRLAVGSFGRAWSFSPDRSRLALAWSYLPTPGHPAAVRIVDLRRWRSERLIQLPGRLGQALALTWSRERLLVLAQGQTGVDALAFDVDRGKPVFSRRVSGNLMRAHARASGFVAFEGQANSIGGAQLLLVDATLELRTIPLDRITAGNFWDSTRQTYRQRRPARVVHPDGGTAYVLSADEAPATVDLRSLTVRYGNGRTLSRAAKRADGPVRFGLWAGAHRVVYSGIDLAASRTPKIGVSLVDTKTWAGRVIDPEATAAAVGSELVLTWDSGPAVDRTLGVRVFRAGGGLRFAALPKAAVRDVQIAGPRALVHLSANRPVGTVLDLETGATVTTIRGNVPWLLLGRAASW